MFMPISKEGSPYIIGIAIVATLLSVVSFLYAFLFLKLIVLLCWVLFVLVINFFRDPERHAPVDPSAIISPADGKIIDIQNVMEEQFLHSNVIRVSIFMSVFDVHVNRSPVKGVIDYIHYNKGLYLPAFREKASLDNEQMTVGFTMRSKENGQRELKVMLKLIAGLIARRIVFWKQMRDDINQGERIGMIKFGSRVEVYLPADINLSVKEGDKVKAGETIIGKF